MTRLLLRLATALTLAAALCRPAAAAVPTTSTAFAVTAGGSPVTTVAAGTVVTLTATVTGAGLAVHPGLVRFCDVTGGAPCTFLHLLGTVPLGITNGVATYRFRPPVGTHVYSAMFVGTKTYPTSTSSASTLVVTGSNSTTAISQSGSPGNYTLSATVTGTRPSFPTGSVSFQNTSKGNSVVASASLVAGSSTTTFTTLGTTNRFATPYAAAVGDFNNDGIPDMAVISNTGNSGNSVYILTGNGDGTFSIAGNLSTGRAPQGIVAADFNGDGYLDLAIVNEQDGSINIYKGGANLAFTAGTTVTVSTTGLPPTQAIVAADFNNDGILDLAVPASNGIVYILKGNGDATFTALSSPSIPNYANSIVAADFNADGNADLAVVSDGTTSVAILRGNGDGTFGGYTTLTTGNGPASIAVGDFNGDGHADLAVGNNSDGTISIFKGNGDMTFTALASPSVGTYPRSVNVADFNGDGIADLVVANYSGGTITVLKGSGTGTFSALGNATVTTPFALVTADFNGDGTPDIVTFAGGNYVVNTVLTSGTATATATQTGVSASGAIQASFPGDANYSASTSGTTSITAPDSTFTTVNSVNPNSTIVGNNTVLTATVTDTTNSQTYPVGTVTFSTMVNGVTYTAGTANVVSGVAQLTYNAAYGGTNTITAAYTPSNPAAFAASSYTGGATLTVAAATPVQYDNTNDQTVVQGTATTLTIVIAYPGTVAPTGAITLRANGNVIAGLGSPTCVAKARHMNCGYPYTPSLTPNAYTLTYSVAADSNYNASSGTSTLTVVGNALRLRRGEPLASSRLLK